MAFITFLPLRALRGSSTVKQQKPTGVSSRVRADVYRSNDASACQPVWGVRCVATASDHPFETLDFVPLFQCHSGCPADKPYKCTDSQCYALASIARACKWVTTVLMCTSLPAEVAPPVYPWQQLEWTHWAKHRVRVSFCGAPL